MDKTALEDFGVEQPQSMMEQLLAMLWDEICEKVWDARNEILHSSKNKASADEMQTLEEKLLWYRRKPFSLWVSPIVFLTSYSLQSHHTA